MVHVSGVAVIVPRVFSGQLPHSSRTLPISKSFSCPKRNILPPFAMWLAFPASDYYGGSATWPSNFRPVAIPATRDWPCARACCGSVIIRRTKGRRAFIWRRFGSTIAKRNEDFKEQSRRVNKSTRHANTSIIEFPASRPARTRPRDAIVFSQHGQADGESGPSAWTSHRREMNRWARVAFGAEISPMTWSRLSCAGVFMVG